MRLTGTCVLVLSVFAFAVPAYAGNANGNGKGSGGDGSPGNSANAPGQVKKEEAPAATPTTTTATTTTSATTTVAQQSAPPAGGVKPSNETAHETHAQAQSKDTKLYGNGQTAGQIAMGNGAPGSTNLHGPGNSQPHKAAPCGGGHERDVHALKGKHAAGSCGNPTPTPTPNPTPTPTPDPPRHDNTPPVVVVTTGDKKPTASDPAPQPDPSPTESGAEESSSGNVEGDTQGAVEATGQVAGTGALPFTGQELWLAVLAGIAMIAAGLGLRQIRSAEAAVESGHDHTDRTRHPARSSRPTVGGRSGR
jgi:hypothetical protein